MATMNSGLGGPAGFGETVFSTTSKAAGDNVDGSIQIDVTPAFGSGGIKLFDKSYTDIYVNSNGLITFEGPNTAFSFSSLGNISEPAIAAFATDANIEDGGEIYVDVDSATGKVTITWDGVAPFSGSGANSFQVVLTSTGDGDFDIEYIFEDIQYTNGSSSTAVAGITDGADRDFELEGSGDAATLTNYETNDFDNGDPTGTFSLSFVDGISDVFFETVTGGNSDDVIDASFTDGSGSQVSVGDDIVYGGGGNDSVDASRGNDRLYGGVGNDSLAGASGSDVLFGGSGNDTISADPDGGSLEDVVVTATNFSDTSSGYTVVAQNVVGGVLSSADVSNIATFNGVFGASGTISDSDSSQQSQVGFDKASGISEKITITLDAEVESASFDFNFLFTSSFGEVGHYAVFDGGVLVHEADFTEDSAGSGSGTVNISGFGAFDSIVFTAILQTDGTDGSDYGISNFTFQAPGASVGDTLYGGDGTDRFVMGNAFGADTIYGGSGNDDIDTIDLSALSNGVTVTFSGSEDGSFTDGSDTAAFEDIEAVLGTAHVDTLDGRLSTTRVTLDGADGSDVLYGGDGGDRLYGGAGDDRMEGGAGFDRFFVTDGHGNDSITDSDNSAVISGGAITNDISVVLTGDFSGTWTSGGDVISFAGVNDFTLGTGDDVLNLSASTGGIDNYAVGGTGNDTVFGGSGDEDFRGGSGNDMLYGNAGDDYMEANEGHDTFYGGAGDDRFDTFGGVGDLTTFYGGAGNDLMLASDSTNTAYGGAGNDDFFGDDGNDVLAGGTGNDLLMGENDADTFLMEDAFGADQIYGGEGVTTGTDFDVLDFTAMTGGVTVTFATAEDGSASDGSETATFFEIEDVLFTAHGDTIDISALTTDETILGLAGDDSISGGTGNDRFLGDTGNDTIAGGAGSDLIYGGTGNDSLTTGIGEDTLYGGAGEDNLANSAGNDTLFGGTGNDTITASLGDDLLYGGSGNDLLYGGQDDDTLYGGTGSDALYAGIGNDLVYGGDDQDTIFVDDSFGTDTLYGGEGGTDLDTLDLTTLGTGVTVTFTGSEQGTFTDGTDTGTFFGIENIVLSDQKDEFDAFNDTVGITVDGRAGNDSIQAGQGDDVVYGGDGEDSLSGFSGEDTVYAGSGDDRLVGRSGNDTLFGGSGNDEYDTDFGQDTFYGGTGDDRANLFVDMAGETLYGGEGGEGSGDLLHVQGDFAGADVTVIASGTGDGTATINNDTASFFDFERFRLTSGNDVFDGSALSSGVEVEFSSGDNFALGGSGDDLITSGDGADSIASAAGSDTVYAGTGDDRIAGGIGSDLVYAGDDQDTILVDDSFGTDTVYGGEGGTDLDTLDLTALGTGVTVTFTGDEQGTFTDGTDTGTFFGIEDVILTDQADVADASGLSTGVILDGRGGADSIDGSTGSDVLYGGTGNDHIDAHDGLLDTVYGGAGDDSLEAGAGNDLVYGGADADVIGGQDGNDTLYGGDGADSIHVGTGDDTAFGGTGNDTLEASSGNQTLFGGTGNDFIDVDEADGSVIADGGSGIDILDFDPSTAGFTAAFTGDDQGTFSSDGGGASGSFTNIEELEGTGFADQFDASLDTNGVTLDAASGDDSLTGGSGDDRLDADSGNDTVFGGAGNDSITGDAGNDTITGGTGNDSMEGGDGANLFLFEDGFGSDSVDASSAVGGDDTLDFSALTDAITVTSSTGDTGQVASGVNSVDFTDAEVIVGTTLNDSFDGSNFTEGVDFLAGAGSDSILAGSSTDTIDGGSGSDTIDAGAGADIVYGGDDADVIIVDDGFGTDAIYGGEGGSDSDTLDLTALGTGVTVTFTGNEQGTFTDGTDTGSFFGIENIVLTDQNDDYDASNDTVGVELDGGGGDDSLAGGSGSDTLNGGSDDDAVFGGGGDDSILGGSGTGRDEIYGGDGADSVDGGQGADRVYGGDGNDTLDGERDADTLFGGAGSDSVIAGSGSDTVYGDAGDDSISGDAGFDTLFGGAGNDAIDGGASSDTLIGGAGNDTLTGGSGNDTFVLSSGGGDDAITDIAFGGAENDQIDSSALTDAGNVLTNQDGTVTADEVTVTGGGGSDQVLTFPNGETLTVPDGTVDTSTQATQFASLVAMGVPACFAPGTLILTERGEVPVQRLKVGDRLITQDHGPQPLRWIGRRVVVFNERNPRGAKDKPIEIKAGTLGVGLPRRTLVVSPQHRMVLSGPEVEAITGVSEVLTLAKAFTARDGIRRMKGLGRIVYFSLLLDRHEIIFAEGAPTESFRPGPLALQGFEREAREQVYAIYPRLRDEPVEGLGPSARLILSRQDAEDVVASLPRQQPPSFAEARERLVNLSRFDNDLEAEKKAWARVLSA